jgi:hypothetical protein
MSNSENSPSSDAPKVIGNELTFKQADVTALCRAAYLAGKSSERAKCRIVAEDIAKARPFAPVESVATAIAELPSIEEHDPEKDLGVIFMVGMTKSTYAEARAGDVFVKPQLILRVRNDKIELSQRPRISIALRKMVSELQAGVSPLAVMFGPERSGRIAVALEWIASSIEKSDAHPNGFSLRPYSRFAMAALSGLGMTTELPMSDDLLDLFMDIIEQEAVDADQVLKAADEHPSYVAAWSTVELSALCCDLVDFSDDE